MYLDQREPSCGYLKVEAGGRELKHCLGLLSGDSGKPFDELIDGCAVLEVFEECPHRHSRICEHPRTAHPCRVSLNCAAMSPRIHGAPFADIGPLNEIYGRSHLGSIDNLADCDPGTTFRLRRPMRPTASSREPILHHHLGQSQLATLGHGGFRCLADGNHEADHVFATCPPSSGTTFRERFCQCQNQREATVLLLLFTSTSAPSHPRPVAEGRQTHTSFRTHPFAL